MGCEQVIHGVLLDCPTRGIHKSGWDAWGKQLWKDKTGSVCTCAGALFISVIIPHHHHFH